MKLTLKPVVEHINQRCGAGKWVASEAAASRTGPCIKLKHIMCRHRTETYHPPGAAQRDQPRGAFVPLCSALSRFVPLCSALFRFVPSRFGGYGLVESCLSALVSLQFTGGIRMISTRSAPTTPRPSLIRVRVPCEPNVPVSRTVSRTVDAPCVHAATASILGSCNSIHIRKLQQHPY
jgi:hypothetical protein